MSPYVGMARKQNGGYNASISVQTLIFHLVVNSTRLKTVRSALWRCPNSTVALRLLENVVKVTNQEVVKIEFRHLPFLLLLSFSRIATVLSICKRKRRGPLYGAVFSSTGDLLFSSYLGNWDTLLSQKTSLFTFAMNISNCKFNFGRAFCAKWRTV